MISTRRIAAAVGLAAGIAGLAVPSANAAEAGAPLVGKLGAPTMLDTLAVSGIPESQQGRVPRVSEQMQSLEHLKELNQLSQVEQVLAPAAPLLGLVGAVH
ncbi:hypothetical protein JK359_20805 [Streptomyces actinomycinicus]|uniref:Secreted protein n=1 Tax=Streptomyces actinomycinicus TaxID=1695166 RepID=A0A937ELM9_9ACTN|nr:hypothetical protein [Streptomyces actinomycinicus]MBL1084376.1 hypothetical protein [Streptomyces actinomycinicus]